MMNYPNACFALVILTLALTLPLPALSQRLSRTDDGVRVAGCVVDFSGQPVAGALVWLYWPCSNTCPDQLFPGHKTGASGVFYLETYSPEKEVLLFMNTPAPENAWSPLSYLTEEERQQIPIMRGRRLRSRKKTIDLGDVRTTFQYGTVLVDIGGLFGPFGTKNQFNGLYLKVSRKGTVVDKGNVPPSAFPNDLEYLRIALPVGLKPITWTLELREDRTRSISPVNVKVELAVGKCRLVSRPNRTILITDCPSPASEPQTERSGPQL